MPIRIAVFPSSLSAVPVPASALLPADVPLSALPAGACPLLPHPAVKITANAAAATFVIHLFFIVPSISSVCRISFQTLIQKKKQVHYCTCPDNPGIQSGIITQPKRNHMPAYSHTTHVHHTAAHLISFHLANLLPVLFSYLFGRFLTSYHCLIHLSSTFFTVSDSDPQNKKNSCRHMNFTWLQPFRFFIFVFPCCLLRCLSFRHPDVCFLVCPVVYKAVFLCKIIQWSTRMRYMRSSKGFQ